MKANQVATLVLRLMGIYFLVEIIPELPLIGDYIFVVPNDKSLPNTLNWMFLSFGTSIIVGVLIFASALPQLLTSIYTLLRAMSSDKSITYPYEIGRNQIESSVGMFLKAALGLWLFLGADGFTRFFSSLRNFGTPKPPQTP